MTPRFDVVVVGAGLAGLAAAQTLARSGAKVALVDRRPFVGGRAYSYPHPVVGDTVDSQHVMVGACTALKKLCADAGISDRIRWYSNYTFLEPGGRTSVLKPSGLPSPGHNSISFLTAPMLGPADKVAVARALLPFLHGYPAADDESVAAWLARVNLPPRAVRHFIYPVIVSALNDVPERCSMKYAGQVFHETFLKSAEGGRFGIPTLPLSDFYGAVADDAMRNGASLWQSFSVRSIAPSVEGWTVCGDREQLFADRVVLALPFDQVRPLLQDDIFQQVLPLGVGSFVHSPITTVHLWYDRDVVGLDHAVLLDTTIEWMFCKSRIRNWNRERGCYVELTISASHRQLRMSAETILAEALAEFQSFFPQSRGATLLKHLVLKEAKATFSVIPGLDCMRPAQKTVVPGLFLAGDWTNTDWPSTMEGAVRSGFRASEAILGQSVLPPDLAPAGFMRWLARQ